MSKKSIVEREKKRYLLSKKFISQRVLLKKKISNLLSFEEKLVIYFQLQKLPRNSFPVRLVWF